MAREFLLTFWNRGREHSTFSLALFCILYTWDWFDTDHLCFEGFLHQSGRPLWCLGGVVSGETICSSILGTGGGRRLSYDQKLKGMPQRYRSGHILMAANGNVESPHEDVERRWGADIEGPSILPFLLLVSVQLSWDSTHCDVGINTSCSPGS